MAKQQWVGGSFAPPLSDEQLAKYRSLIDGLPASPLKDHLSSLHRCCSRWWDLPESTGAGRPHPVGMGTIVDLDEPIKLQLDEHIPWDEELAMIQGLCDSIDPSQAELRNAAFHLLWHVKELALDREPLTNDKL